VKDTLEFLELLPTLINFYLDGCLWFRRLSLRKILDGGRGGAASTAQELLIKDYLRICWSDSHR